MSYMQDDTDDETIKVEDLDYRLRYAMARKFYALK